MTLGHRHRVLLRLRAAPTGRSACICSVTSSTPTTRGCGPSGSGCARPAADGPRRSSSGWSPTTCPITWDRVAAARRRRRGRPAAHRSGAGRGRGRADVNAAFAELLSSRSKYYVGTPNTDVFTAIDLVRAAGGVPVFAHPLARRRGRVVGRRGHRGDGRGGAGRPRGRSSRPRAGRSGRTAPRWPPSWVCCGPARRTITARTRRLRSAPRRPTPDQYERLVDLRRRGTGGRVGLAEVTVRRVSRRGTRALRTLAVAADCTEPCVVGGVLVTAPARAQPTPPAPRVAALGRRASADLRRRHHCRDLEERP